jgi:hypothetical protein
MANAGQTIKLQSSDGDTFDVDIVIIKQSGVLKGFSDSKNNRLRMINCFNLSLWIFNSGRRYYHSSK